MRVNNPNIFQPQQSRIRLYYLIFIHLFSFVCVYMLAPLFLDGIFLMLLPVSFYYFFQNEKIKLLHYIKKTEWILKLSSDEAMHVVLLPSSVMMRYFVVMHFKVENSNQKIKKLFFCDYFSKADYQALRRCMRMGYL